jgi:hypothetical protein
MVQAAVAPDAVLWAVTALDAELAEAVGGRSHKTAEKYVRVQRTGGGDGTRISDMPQLTFECYAGDDAAASELCNRVRATLQSFAGQTLAGVQCYRVSAAGVSDRPDPRTPDLSRYAFTAVVHLRSATMEV